jgi:SAM-dependent methyltransferase
MNLGQVRKIWQLARAYKPEVESWYTAYKIGWFLAKTPKGLNERQLEWPWVLEEATQQKIRGQLLDVGSLKTNLPQKLSELGFTVTALDCRVPEPRTSSHIRMVTGDIRSISFLDATFDLITCISTLEHIGVKGRYGVIESDPDGDQKAMAEMLRLLKPEGKLLLTVPIGARDVLPINKCYSESRIKNLNRGLHLAKTKYSVYVTNSGWEGCTRAEAEKTNWYFSNWYAIGCFVIVKGN